MEEIKMHIKLWVANVKGGDYSEDIGVDGSEWPGFI
jgi:hypothetical protein